MEKKQWTLGKLQDNVRRHNLEQTKGRKRITEHLGEVFGLFHKVGYRTLALLQGYDFIARGLSFKIQYMAGLAVWPSG